MRETIGRSSAIRWAITPWLPLGLLLGCGGSGLEKVVIEGTVRYDGQLVDNGEILFCPVDGTQGPVSGASIKEGSYRAEGKGGVPVGTHEVRIRGYGVDPLAAERLAKDPDAVVGAEQFLPEKYNERSELRRTIPTDAPNGILDFDLSP